MLVGARDVSRERDLAAECAHAEVGALEVAVQGEGQVDLGLQGPIVWSYILTSMLGPFEGKVLCSGSGSQIVTITDDAGDQHDVWQLRSLGVLEGSGSSRVTGCLR